ncbi:MAG: TIGR01212 family radical SAM protein [Nitrospinota bacterium]|nr:TIGR01212 family radical SAM protein [Nitrospinota bacterium]
MPARSRYRTINETLRAHFGEKVSKISVDGGMSCPNLDGTISSEGCIYCLNGSHYGKNSIRALSVREQILNGIDYIRNVKPEMNKFIAYFQAYSNTYADTDYLKKIYEEALSIDRIVGLSIATRPDCLDKEKIELLKTISQKKYLWLELGLESMHNKTLTAINRGHTFETFREAVIMAQEAGIQVCAHTILYLPGEKRKDILQTAAALAELRVEGVKLHHLHILKGTKLYNTHQSGNVFLPTLQEYVQTVVDFIEYLPPDTVIHRVAGDAPKELLVAPDWSGNKLRIINEVKKELKSRGSYQGKRYGAY